MLVFHIAVEPTVGRLADHRLWAGILLTDANHLPHLGGLEVREAPVADLSRLNQAGHDLDRRLERCFGVGPVQQIEVDVVGLKPLKAGVDLPHQVRLGESGIVFVGPDRVSRLGRQDRVLASSLQCLTQKGLGLAAGRAQEARIAFVHVGRVDEGRFPRPPPGQPVSRRSLCPGIRRKLRGRFSGRRDTAYFCGKGDPCFPLAAQCSIDLGPTCSQHSRRAVVNAK